MKTLALTAIALILAAGCTAKASKGDEAPMFTVIDSEGTEFALANLTSEKPVLLFFMSSTGCSSCELETKGTLSPLYAKYQSKVHFLSIDELQDSSNDMLRAFKARNKAPWPHALDRDGVSIKYQASLLGTTVVIGQDHKVLFRGQDPTASQLEAVLPA